MKTKSSIALALSHHAELIMMDELTSGLDPVVRQEILELMAELIQDGEKTIFFLDPHHVGSGEHRRLHHLHPRRPPVLQPDQGGNTGSLPGGQGGTELLDADKRKLFLGLRKRLTALRG